MGHHPDPTPATEQADQIARIDAAAGLDCVVTRTGEIAWRMQRVLHKIQQKPGATIGVADVQALIEVISHYKRMHRTLESRRGG